MTTADLLCAARAVKPAAAALSTAEKNRLLEAMAQALLDHAEISSRPTPRMWRPRAA